MAQNTFIDRYFHSQFELLDIRYAEERDVNTLFSYLENLHSTADKLKDNFSSKIKDTPEFKLLRLIRNYSHHVGDVDELRMYVTLDKDIFVSHAEHLIIPLELFAKSIKSFILKNTVSVTNKNYQSKQKFIDKEIDALYDCCDCYDVVKYLDCSCNKPQLKLDGKLYELGFDLYALVYNMSNIIADECREIVVLRDKDVVSKLDRTYSKSNNIPKRSMICRPSNVPILTTKGFVFADKIELAI